MVRTFLFKEDELTILAVLLLTITFLSFVPWTTENIAGMAGGAPPAGCISPLVSTTVVVSGEVHLCPGEYVGLKIEFPSSNSVLNCNGARIIGGGSIEVSNLENVAIRNCRFHNTRTLDVRGGKNILLENLELVKTGGSNALSVAKSWEGISSDNVIFRNSTIIRPNGDGIDISDSTNVVLEDSRVIGRGTTGKNGIVLRSPVSLRNVLSCNNKIRDIHAYSSPSESVNITCNTRSGITCHNSCPPIEPEEQADCYNPYDFMSEYDFSSGIIRFCPGTYYMPLGFSYTQKSVGDVIIDCQGATIIANQNPVPDPAKTGFKINGFSSNYYGRPVGPWGAVLIKNCNIKNFGIGMELASKYNHMCQGCTTRWLTITVRNSIFKDNLKGISTPSHTTWGEQENIIIEESSFENNDVGVDGMFKGLLLQQNSFSNNNIGIRILFKNRENVVKNNAFENNKAGLHIEGNQRPHTYEGNVFSNQVDIFCLNSRGHMFINNVCEHIDSSGCCASGNPPCAETPHCGLSDEGEIEDDDNNSEEEEDEDSEADIIEEDDILWNEEWDDIFGFDNDLPDELINCSDPENALLPECSFDFDIDADIDGLDFPDLDDPAQMVEKVIESSITGVKLKVKTSESNPVCAVSRMDSGLPSGTVAYGVRFEGCSGDIVVQKFLFDVNDAASVFFGRSGSWERVDSVKESGSIAVLSKGTGSYAVVIRTEETLPPEDENPQRFDQPKRRFSIWPILIIMIVLGGLVYLYFHRDLLKPAKSNITPVNKVTPEVKTVIVKSVRAGVPKNLVESVMVKSGWHTQDVKPLVNKHAYEEKTKRRRELIDKSFGKTE